jgi:hypothetical protein
MRIDEREEKLLEAVQMKYITKKTRTLLRQKAVFEHHQALLQD